MNHSGSENRKQLEERAFGSDALSSHNKKHGKNAADHLLLAFLLIGVGIFIIYPLIMVLLDGFFVDGTFTLSVFRDFLENDVYLLGHSFFTAIWSSVLSTIWGLVIAYSAVASSGKKKRLIMVLLMMTMVSPPFISSLTYIQLYGRRGWITYRLLRLSIKPYNKWGIIAMQSLHFTTLNALFLISFIESIDGRLIQAARDLGAKPGTVIRTVILPLLKPAIAATWGLSFVRSLADFGTPAVIGGRYSTLAAEIYMQIIGYGHEEKAAAMNLFLMVPAFLAFLFYRYSIKQSEKFGSSDRTQSALDPKSIRMKGLGGIVVKLITWFYLVVMVLQYACIFLSGFLKSKKGQYYFSLDNFDELFAYNVGSIWLSVKLALITAFFGTVFGLLLSYYMERRMKRGRDALDFVVSLPYLLPGTCFGLGYIMAFHKEPLKLTGTAAIIILNMMFRQLPVVTRVGSAALTQISTRLEDAARDLGADRISVIKDIIFPNLGSAFVTGFIYQFASAMTTAGAVMFLISAHYKIAVYTLFDAINRGKYGVASLLSSMIIVITILVSLATHLLFNRKKSILSSAGGQKAGGF